ncbi:MAG: hypothetical protein M3R13_03020 [Armatimonadota bacterium]|nr:hypothetical protein [Armatimonadota bacterium]
MKRIFVFALAVACTAALAQGPGSGGGSPQEGPRGGRMGMQMGMQRGGGLRIITRPDVQKELAVTETQKTAIAELFPNRRGAGGGPRGDDQPGGPAAGPATGPPPPPPGGQGGANAGPRGQRGDPAAMQAQQAEQEKKLKAILDAKQWIRLSELRLQQEGVNALLRPEVAKEVGLSEDQNNKLKAIQQGSMEAMREAMMAAREGGDMDREAMQAMMEKSRADTEAKMLAVLMEPQKVKWATMQGKPFKFEQIGR